MIVKRTGWFYALTYIFGLTLDRLQRRKHYSKMFTTRWERGQVDICSLGRVWLFGGGYYVALLAIIALSGFFLFIYPYADMPFDVGTKPALFGAAKALGIIAGFIVAFLLVLLAIGGTQWVLHKVSDHMKARRNAAARAKARISANTMQKPPNPLIEAIGLRYKAFKEKTCFFVNVDEPVLSNDLRRIPYSDDDEIF